MKHRFLRKLLTTYLIIFSGLIVTGQNGDSPGISGEEVQCELELSNMAEFMKINLPEYANDAWKKLFEHCPDASLNIYISGAKIYQKKIGEATDPQIKAGLLDTLMLIYDRRIQYFGEEGYVLGRKGMDIIRYNETDFEKAFEAFDRSTALLGNEADLNVITGLIQTGSVMYKSEKIPASKFLDSYLECSGILADKKTAGENPAKLIRVQNVLDNVLTTTRISDCSAIENSLKDRVHSPDVEGDFLKLCVDLLTISGCDNTSFFSDVNERLMEVAPDPDLAYQVAKYNLKNENFEKAAEFLLKAIENEDNDQQKALYEYQLAVVKLSRLNSPVEARNLALSAARHKPEWGEPYFVAASALIEGIKSCNIEAFEKQTVYWLAVDYCVKAKNVDPNVTSQANELISQYKSYFPSVEETFFRSLKEGDKYTVGCWINETTTVKLR